MIKKPHKIALLYTGGSSMSGIENYLQTLMINNHNQDYYLELLSLGEWDLTENLIRQGAPVKIFNKHRLSLKTMYQIGQYLQENQFNLLVSHGSLSNLYARLVANKFKIPNLVTVHSRLENDYMGIIRILHWFVDRVFRKATKHYLVVSNFLKQDLISKGIIGSKVSQVYNGVDFISPKNNTRGFPDFFTVGSLGRLHSLKNYDTLIQALALTKNSKIKLIIAGEGSERNSLEARIKELNLQNRVSLPGHSNNLTSFFSEIDFYIQPSIMEGFGLAAVEAMFAGKPVLVSPVGGLVELVVHNQTGFVLEDLQAVTIANYLDEFSKLSNREKIDNIAANGQKTATQNFSVKKFINETLKVYDEAIKL